MPGIDWEALEDDDTPRVQRIRRNTSPVSGRHDMQRRAENGRNRIRKARREKLAAETATGSYAEDY